MNERKQRGLQLAATARITRNGNVWEVPSQTLNGRVGIRYGDNNLQGFEVVKRCLHWLR